jgi:hypothetical protein
LLSGARPAELIVALVPRGGGMALGRREQRFEHHLE